MVSIWPVDSLPQLNLSTAQKFRHSSWRASWQFCWILTQDLITFSQSFCDNCIWHSLLCSQWCRFAAMSHVPIRRDVPWASCQIRKIAGAHAPGMPGTFSPSPQVNDPDMHHGTCVTHMPWSMSGSLTIGFLWNRRRGKTFPAFPAHAQPAILRIW